MNKNFLSAYFKNLVAPPIAFESHTIQIKLHTGKKVDGWEENSVRSRDSSPSIHGNS